MALRKNIEIKARCRNLEAARDAAEALGARFDRVLHQVDTYFHVPNGRLKLREIRDGRINRAELIWYARANRAAARDSRYHLVPAPAAKPMKAALTAALAVRNIVVKRRELWMYRNVRIHLDRVRGLGTFIEFEAVISPSHGVAISRRRLDELCEALRIKTSDQLATSYGEM